MSKNHVKILSYFLIALVVGGLYFGWYLPNKKVEQTEFITYKEPGLTDQEKQLFLDKINADIEKLAGENLSDDDIFVIQLDLGAQYYAIGEFGKSRTAFVEATKAIPTNATGWAELYRAEAAMTDYENAEKHLQKAISINPANHFYWRWLLELERGPLNLPSDKVKQGYEEALRVTYSHVDILTHYGAYLKDIGDLAGAVKQYKKAIEINPEGKALYEQEIAKIQDLVQ